MRVALSLCFALIVGLPALAGADIYKCTDAQGVVYQAAPCSPGQTGAPMMLQQRAPAPLPAPRADTVSYGRNVAFGRTALALGMSDDEALNLPGWGVPNRIERSREGRVYREEWTYPLPGGGARRLSFANAKLTAVQIEPAPTDPIASATAR